MAAPQAQLTVFPTPTPGPDGKIIYIVQPNDTLWRISAITGVKIEAIRELNNLGVNDTIVPGDRLLLGFAGPAAGVVTEGPPPTLARVTPSSTPAPGWGILCVLLYNDLNGDSMRQETEPSIPEGEISISNRLGTVSLTAQTPAGGTNPQKDTPQEKGYTCFEELLEGEYLISVAAPEGYNRTTALNQTLRLQAGQTTLLAFGAQANSELQAQTALIPESPRKSPIMGILGGALLLAGAGLGIYAYLLRRTVVIKPKN
ncbi:MAG: LysM peptidoglycan-binding domain-containing protein [Acidobacteriaceae bacterium]